MPGNSEATLYIGNLDDRVDERVLYEIMLQAGPLEEVYIPRNKETKRHKGYAFAEFATEESAQYALSLFSGLLTLYNRSLRLAIPLSSMESGASNTVPHLNAQVCDELSGADRSLQSSQQVSGRRYVPEKAPQMFTETSPVTPDRGLDGVACQQQMYTHMQPPMHNGCRSLKDPRCHQQGYPQMQSPTHLDTSTMQQNIRYYQQFNSQMSPTQASSIRVPTHANPIRVPTHASPIRVPTHSSPLRVPTLASPIRMPTHFSPLRIRMDVGCEQQVSSQMQGTAPIHNNCCRVQADVECKQHGNSYYQPVTSRMQGTIDIDIGPPGVNEGMGYYQQVHRHMHAPIHTNSSPRAPRFHPYCSQLPRARLPNDRYLLDNSAPAYFNNLGLWELLVTQGRTSF